MLGSRRGISPILATLLLIVIAVASVIVTYAWLMTFTTTQTHTAGAVLIKENVRFYETDTNKDKTDITIRNTGTAGAKVVAVYWSDSSFANLVELKKEIDYTGEAVVSPESSTTFTITWNATGGIIEDYWESGKTYYFKVVTEAGPYLEFPAKAP